MLNLRSKGRAFDFRRSCRSQVGSTSISGWLRTGKTSV